MTNPPSPSRPRYGVSDALTEHTEDPESYTLRKDLGRTVQEGLETLPDDQRTAVVLSDIEGLRYKEIAEITGAELGTVKSRIHRGRVLLRDYLRRQEPLVVGEPVSVLHA
ncbi:MAG: ECF RNA polymerase sigma factor SigE [Anaerolineales bacterium]|nr:ECF RNA polymerase sigma factor SigE [Anaerolineales bacterium]